MDLNIITLRGTVVTCPKPLKTGQNILLSLRAYFLPAAFESFRVAPINGSEKGQIWAEGTETLDEQILRERKTSLLQLFDAVSLKPTRSSAAASALEHTSPLDQLSQRQPERSEKGAKTRGDERGKTREIIGDDEDAEEIEVEGEVIGDDQLDMIYRKSEFSSSSIPDRCFLIILDTSRAQQNDQSLQEMEPPITFALDLRPYQKQALKSVPNHLAHQPSHADNEGPAGCSISRQASRMHGIRCLWIHYGRSTLTILICSILFI